MGQIASILFRFFTFCSGKVVAHSAQRAILSECSAENPSATHFRESHAWAGRIRTESRDKVSDR